MNLLTVVIIAMIAAVVGGLALLAYQERQRKRTHLITSEEIPQVIRDHEDLRDNFVEMARETIAKATDEDLAATFDESYAKWKATKEKTPNGNT